MDKMEKMDKAFWLNRSPSAASTAVPWEASRPASERMGQSSLSPERITLSSTARGVMSKPEDSPGWMSSPTSRSWMDPQTASLEHSTQAQERLAKAAQRAAAQLGPGHEIVEAAKRHLRDLRSRQGRLCFRATTRRHEETLATELEGAANGDGSGFQAALRAAEADLGAASPVVQKARRAAHEIKMRQKTGAQKELEAKHSLDILACSESKDLRVLADSIQAAAKALGAAHPIVEKGRQEFLQQRHDLQRQQWEDCVAVHHTLMVQACESQDPEQIEARILASSHSPLGQGHDIVMYGKRYLLWLRRALQRNSAEARFQQVANVLRASAVEAERELRLLEASA